MKIERKKLYNRKALIPKIKFFLKVRIESVIENESVVEYVLLLINCVLQYFCSITRLFVRVSAKITKPMKIFTEIIL